MRKFLLVLLLIALLFAVFPVLADPPETTSYSYDYSDTNGTRYEGRGTTTVHIVEKTNGGRHYRVVTESWAKITLSSGRVKHEGFSTTRHIENCRDLDDYTTCTTTGGTRYESLDRLSRVEYRNVHGELVVFKMWVNNVLVIDNGQPLEPEIGY